MYTHHDNAIQKIVDINSTINHVRLSPNRRFDNIQGRDEAMYNLSDLSNLNHSNYIKKKNSIDKYLEIENIFPHQKTLAHGY